MHEGFPAHTEVELRRLDLVTQVRAQLRRVAYHSRYRRKCRCAVRRVDNQTDTQLARRYRAFIEIGTQRRHDVVGLTHCPALHGIQQCCTVAHAFAEGELHGQTTPHFIELRTIRHAATAGFDAEQAVECRWHADRSTAIGGVGHWHHACGNGGTRAATRTAGIELRIPRIARHTGGYRFGGGAGAHLRCGSATDGGQTCRRETLHKMRVFTRHAAGRKSTAQFIAPPCSRANDVLDQEGHAGKRS